MKNRNILALLAGAFVLTVAACGTQSKEPVDFKVEEKKASEVKINEKASPDTKPKVAGIAPDAPKTVSQGAPVKFPFRVYSDKNSPDNHYIPSGWMGDYGDLKYDGAHFDNPHSGTTCIKITYNNKMTQGARWSGIYWQNPANNWGTRPGGFDLTGAKKFVFWARGENGTERIEEFKIGGITGEHADSDVAGIGPVMLSQEWKEFTIDLANKDLSYISGGFVWATNLDVNPDGAVFYLDDLRYE